MGLDGSDLEELFPFMSLIFYDKKTSNFIKSDDQNAYEIALRFCAITGEVKEVNRFFKLRTSDH